MKYNDFSDLTPISSYKFENFFNVQEDLRNNKFFNLIKSINVFQSNNDEVEESYYIKPSDTWISISFDFYNTLDLWWLICVYNQIHNPLELPLVGTKIKILKSRYVGIVLQELASQTER
jgi:hypothetical protein